VGEKSLQEDISVFCFELVSHRTVRATNLLEGTAREPGGSGLEWTATDGERQPSVAELGAPLNPIVQTYHQPHIPHQPPYHRERSAPGADVHFYPTSMQS